MRDLRIFVGIAAAAILLAGCGGGESGAKSSSGDVAHAPEGLSAPRAPGAGNAAKQSGPNAKQVALAPGTGRLIIYTANLQVGAKNVGDATGRAKQIVTAAGGYVSNENDSSAPGTAASTSVTFQVPVGQYTNVLGQLSGLGTKVSLTQQAQDVTQDVADVDSRVGSARASLASLRTLMSKANTVGDVINVEQEISQRESDLESLEARQKALNAETSYATISLQLNGTAVVARHQGHHHGLAGGFATGWNAFVDVVAALALALAWSLPFLAPAAAIGLVVRWLRRRRGVLQRPVN